MEREYESMLILKPDLGENNREEVFQKICKKIEELGGKVLSSKIWAKERQFCYPLTGSGAGKNTYFKGGYWLINFNLDTEKLSDWKETVRLEEKILRNIILNRGSRERF